MLNCCCYQSEIKYAILHEKIHLALLSCLNFHFDKDLDVLPPESLLALLRARVLDAVKCNSVKMKRRCYGPLEIRDKGVDMAKSCRT